MRIFIHPDGSRKGSLTKYNHKSNPDIRSSRTYLNETVPTVEFNTNGIIQKN